MLVNVVICGTNVPVEVTEEELNKNGYFKNLSEEDATACHKEGGREVKDAIWCELVNRMDIDETQGELMDCSVEWENFRDEIFNLNNEEFAEKVLNGELLKAMNEKALELIPNEIFYEVEIEVSRMVRQTQTITATIKGTDEYDAKEKMSNISYTDIEHFIERHDWETDDYDTDYEEIEDWSLNGEINENYADNIIDC